jgi:hypothetical protein
VFEVFQIEQQTSEFGPGKLEHFKARAFTVVPYFRRSKKARAFVKSTKYYLRQLEARDRRAF